MDKGWVVQGGYRVEPCQDGGWIVRTHGEIWAFTDAMDLIEFLAGAHAYLIREERDDAFA